MALTAAAHHSAEKVAADVKDAGLRAQTMVSAGQRPGVLTEPEPQGGGSHGRLRSCPSAVAGRAAAGRRGRRSCGLLLASVPSSAVACREEEGGGGGGEEEGYGGAGRAHAHPVYPAHSWPTCRGRKARCFPGLESMVLCQRGREEKEKEEKEEAPEDFFCSSSSTSSWCTVTAMWAWVPLSLFVVWSSLDIMAGTDQKYSYVLMCKVGFPNYSAPRAVFPSLSSGPRCSASGPVWTRRIFSACARLGLLVFDDVPRCCWFYW